MKKWFLHTMACLLALIGFTCTDETETMPTTDTGIVKLRLQLALPAGGTASRAENITENGTDWENYIDFNDENQYRIYFFDSEENTFIARFTPSEVRMGIANQYILYTLEGDVPEALIPESGSMDFKIVVLGNWKVYTDPEAGKTKIEDICTDQEKGTFDCFTDGFELGWTKRIPFYGVHEYHGISFADGEMVILAEPVTMLRAMAKVEVMLEADDLSLENVSIYRYNRKGYCAPKRVESQEDYEVGKPLDLHLVGGVNAPVEEKLPLTKDGTGKWIAYLPEYRNIGVDDYSYIEVKFTSDADDDEPRKIYFATYTNGTTDNVNTKRMDIERNTIYRFAVHANPLLFHVSVDRWEYGGKVHIDVK